MAIFLSNEIPYDELEKIGLSKSHFLDLPTDILDRLLTGRLSSIMRLIMEKDGEKYSFLAKIAFKKKDDRVKLLIYPVLKEIPNEINLSDSEIEILKSGGVVKKKVVDEEGKSLLSYIQLDAEINNLISVPIRSVYIPQTIGGIELNKEELKSIKDGQVIELKDRNCCVGIDLQERNGFRYAEGSLANWKRDMLIEWDRINPNVTGYWNTSQNNWEYMEIQSNSLKR